LKVWTRQRRTQNLHKDKNEPLTLM